jgi:hypothetical protein
VAKRPPRRPTRVDTVGSTSVADPTTERALSEVRDYVLRLKTSVANQASTEFEVTEDLEFNDFSALEMNTLGVTNLGSAPGIASRLYMRSGEWYVTDAAGNEVQITSGGALDVGGTNIAHSTYWYSPIFTAGGSATRGPSNDQCRALYMGRAPEALSSINIRWNQAAGGTITYAEWGIATGTMTPGTGPTLTIRGYVDAAAQWAVSGIYNVTVPVTGADIAAGADIWVCYAVNFSAGTPTIRVSGAADPLDTCAMVLRGATRLSTNLNTPLAFTIDAATPAWVAFYL